MGYPISLNLENKTCLIVGGGLVAKRKAEGLLHAQARVIVISPTLAAGFPVITHIEDTYQPQYLDDYQPTLTFAATNDESVNQAVIQDAQARNLLVNAPVDFSNMIVWEQAPLTVAISTGGASPILGQQLRRIVEQSIGQHYADFAQRLIDLREQAINTISTQAARQDFWRQALNQQVFDLVEAGDVEAAYAQVVNAYQEAAR
jgi:siroheme synthase-like protein